MACVADAHALATTNAGPWNPNAIAIQLAGELLIIFGTVNGLTRGRRCRYSRSYCSSIVETPAAPLPMITATRSGATEPGARPASSSALFAAATATSADRSHSAGLGSTDPVMKSVDPISATGTRTCGHADGGPNVGAG